MKSISFFNILFIMLTVFSTTQASRATERQLFQIAQAQLIEEIVKNPTLSNEKIIARLNNRYNRQITREIKKDSPNKEAIRFRMTALSIFYWYGSHILLTARLALQTLEGKEKLETYLRETRHMADTLTYQQTINHTLNRK